MKGITVSVAVQTIPSDSTWSSMSMIFGSINKFLIGI